MDIKKLLELLSIDKLDESKQTEIKEKVESIIEVKLIEKLTEKEAALKEMLVTEYEEKFETYKEDITEKFSNFVDEILEQELAIPDHIVEFARKGELYEDLIEQFKTRLAIDEDMIGDEVKDLLKEARDEIKSLKDQFNAKIEENLTLTVEKDKLEIQTYLMEKVKGLPLEDAEKVIAILEDESDTDVIDKKYDTLIESILEVKKTDEEDDEDEEEEDDDMKKKKKKKDGDDDMKESTLMNR
jgi:hypothetical protein